jgi:hypothetical protein
VASLFRSLRPRWATTLTRGNPEWTAVLSRATPRPCATPNVLFRLVFVRKPPFRFRPVTAVSRPSLPFGAARGPRGSCRSHALRFPEIAPITSALSPSGPQCDRLQKKGPTEQCVSEPDLPIGSKAPPCANYDLLSDFDRPNSCSNPPHRAGLRGPPTRPETPRAARRWRMGLRRSNTSHRLSESRPLVVCIASASELAYGHEIFVRLLQDFPVAVVAVALWRRVGPAEFWNLDTSLSLCHLPVTAAAFRQLQHVGPSRPPITASDK